MEGPVVEDYQEEEKEPVVLFQCGFNNLYSKFWSGKDEALQDMAYCDPDHVANSKNPSKRNICSL